MKTAIVHDWLTTVGGAERVLEAMLKLYPAPVYTLFNSLGKFTDQKITPSILQKIPGYQSFYRHLLPLFPWAVERFDLDDYDLILSSSHAVAKGVKTRPEQLHICYCHTPMRYVWDLRNTYLSEMGLMGRALARPILDAIKKWDTQNSTRVSHFIANSHYVANRIKKNYQRDATVIYPPVKTHLFALADKKDDYYITVARLVPYKKVDLIVEAFNLIPERRLLIIGDGPQMQSIKSKAKKNISLLGNQPDPIVRDYLAKARGFIFAADEDFGIASVEAQAAGTPVIAFGKGGSLETVSKNTGHFFFLQTPHSLINAILKFERKEFDPVLIKAHAEQFSEERFYREYTSFIQQKCEGFANSSKSFKNSR